MPIRVLTAASGLQKNPRQLRAALGKLLRKASQHLRHEIMTHVLLPAPRCSRGANPPSAATHTIRKDMPCFVSELIYGADSRPCPRGRPSMSLRRKRPTGSVESAAFSETRRAPQTLREPVHMELEPSNFLATYSTQKPKFGSLWFAEQEEAGKGKANRACCQDLSRSTVLHPPALKLQPKLGKSTCMSGEESEGPETTVEADA